MRKLGLLAMAGILAVPALVNAKPLNELLADKKVVVGATDSGAAANIYYKDGTRLEFPDAGFDLRLRMNLQSVYSYSDLEGNGDPFIRDTNDFTVRNVRLDLDGHLLNKQFSYRISNDFTRNTDNFQEGSTLQDAYLEWNPCDENEHNIRVGQFKTNIGRQWMVDNSQLQFIDRSNVTNYFNFNRQEGVSYIGYLGDSFMHQVSLFNGNSVVDGGYEGQNLPGLDNNLLATYNFAVSLVGDYDFGYEGDPYNSQDFSWGVGAGTWYGEGEYTGSDGEGSKFREYGTNVETGMRYAGWSAQAEWFYYGSDLRELRGPQSASPADHGFYAQTGVFVVPEELELAGRFGWVEFDKGTSGLVGLPFERQYEVNATVNYYLDGHNLKLMTGPTWVWNKADGVGGEDTMDFRYQAGIFGYF